MEKARELLAHGLFVIHNRAGGQLPRALNTTFSVMDA